MSFPDKFQSYVLMVPDGFLVIQILFGFMALKNQVVGLGVALERDLILIVKLFNNAQEKFLCPGSWIDLEFNFDDRIFDSMLLVEFKVVF